MCIVASPSRFIELLLAISWAVFTGFSCFLVVTSKEVFLCLSKNICSPVQNKEKPSAHYEKCFCLFLALRKVTIVLKTF